MRQDTSIMMKRIAEGSPRLKARTAGAFCLIIIVVASEFTGISQKTLFIPGLSTVIGLRISCASFVNSGRF